MEGRDRGSRIKIEIKIRNSESLGIPQASRAERLAGLRDQLQPVRNKRREIAAVLRSELRLSQNGCGRKQAVKP